MARLIDIEDGFSGTLLARVPRECVEECSTQGRNDEAVDYWVTHKRVRWVADDDTLRRSLRECGAWDDLQEADTRTLRSRALWIGAHDWREASRD